VKSSGIRIFDFVTTPPRRSAAQNASTNSTRPVSVGTVKKSIDTRDVT